MAMFPLPYDKFQCVTTCFGARHLGIDLAAPAGTEVYAAEGGTVAFKGWRGGYGNSVILQHENWYSTYNHLQEVTGKKVGDKVDTGEVIGRVGSTGISTGPHLHFEVGLGTYGRGSLVDPSTKVSIPDNRETGSDCVRCDFSRPRYPAPEEPFPELPPVERPGVPGELPDITDEDRLVPRQAWYDVPGAIAGSVVRALVTVTGIVLVGLGLLLLVVNTVGDKITELAGVL